MFILLRRRIFRTVLVTLLLCCLLVGGISLFGVRTVVDRQYADLVGKTLAQKSANVETYLQQGVRITKQVTENEAILFILRNHGRMDFLKSPGMPLTETEKSATLLMQKGSETYLDSLILPYRGILGMTVFDAGSSLMYSSSGLSHYTFDLLEKEPLIRSFVDANDDSCWSVRDDNINDYYRNSAYLKSKGVISLITRIREHSGTVLGYAIVDFNPDTLYLFFTRQQDTQLLQGVQVSVLNRDGKVLPSERKMLSGFPGGIPAGQVRESVPDPARLFYAYPLNDTGMRMILSLPRSGMKAQGNRLLFAVLSVLIPFLVILIWLASRLTRNLADPLDRLRQTMDASTGGLASGNESYAKKPQGLNLPAGG